MAAVTRRGNLVDQGSRQGQLRVGLAGLAMALVLAALLGRADASPVEHASRALVFLPFFVGTYGVLASFYKTCGVHALSGTRSTAGGSEPVADRSELRAQRRLGAMVVLGSALVAAGATALFLVAR
ncbi:MAG: hypothetical protein JWP97_1177 [Labilithrix sp.]|nr:hypothetical protein [Labilithrix sp.]